MMRIAVVDIGGTFLKYGMFCDGVLSQTGETPSCCQMGGQKLMERVAEVLESLKPFDRIGISTAGQVNTAGGFIKYANSNIPDYTGVQVKQLLENRFGVPVVVENDVNAAAIGEAYYGAAAQQQKKNFLCLTYGTGIGGAVFADDRLIRGADDSAGEFGHLITHGEKLGGADSPMAGTYERHASTTALVRSVMQIRPELDNGRKIFAAFEDPAVREKIDEWIGEVLCGLAGVIYAFNPSSVILGGGVMCNPYVLNQLRSRLPDYVLGGHLPVDLQSAKLGNEAGMMGAGYLALHMTDERQHTLLPY